jgi:hypothetical protein
MGGRDMALPRTHRQVIFTAVLACAAPLHAGDKGPKASLREIFAAAPGQRWTLKETSEAFAWSTEDTAPGLRFRLGGKRPWAAGSASAALDLGTGPFEASWTCHVDSALWRDGSFDGVYVGLSSAEPGEMDESSLSLLIGVTATGPLAGVVRGHRVSREALRTPQLLYGDDRSESLMWPGKYVSPTRMQMSIRRDAQGRLTFTIRHEAGALYYHSGGFHESEDHWERTWRLPDEPARVPLRHFVVFCQDGAAAAPMTGRIDDIAVRALVGVSALEPAEGSVLTGGESAVLHGHRLARGAEVYVGGERAEAEYVDARRLKVTVPDLPEAQVHRLAVINPDGSAAELPGGVALGRFLASVAPAEVSPKRGRIVTLRGGGFEERTVVTFDGEPGEVVERLGPSKLTVRVPAGKPGRCRVAARTGRQAFTGDPAFARVAHPFLLFTAEELEQLCKDAGRPPLSLYVKAVTRLADTKGDVTLSMNTFRSRVQGLLIGYLIDGSNRCRRKLIEHVEKEFHNRSVMDYHGSKVLGMAVVYDTLFGELTPQQRGRFEAYFARALDTYRLAYHTGQDWFMRGAVNSNMRTHVGHGFAAMAIGRTQDTSDVVDLVKHHMRRFRAYRILPDGGSPAGVTYGLDYSIALYVLFGHALERYQGTDEGLLDIPELARLHRAYEVMIGGDGAMNVYGDGPSEATFVGYALAAYLGNRLDRPLMRWWADKLMTKHATGKSPFTKQELAGAARHVNPAMPCGRRDRMLEALLWRGTKPAPKEFPGFPTLLAMPDLQWAMMRSDRSFTPDLAVGITGSMYGWPLFHQHHQLGGFVLQARGERLVIDRLRHGKPQMHSVLVIDGRGPERTGGMITDSWENDGLRVVAVDSTGKDTSSGYGGEAARVRRTFVMVDDVALITLDDVVPGKGKPGEVQSYLQRKAGKRMVLDVKRFGPKGQEKGKAFAYTADPAEPLVTVFLPHAKDKAPPAVQVARDAEGIRVRIAGQPEVRFGKAPAGWGFVLPEGADKAGTVLASLPEWRQAPSTKMTCRRLAKPPEVDGKLDDRAWKGAARVAPFTDAFVEPRPTLATDAWVGYDEKHFYLAMRCAYGRNSPGLRRWASSRDDAVWRDDSVSLFLDVNRDRRSYVQFDVNADGVIHDAAFDEPLKGKGTAWNAACKVRTAIHADADQPFWTAEAAIPWADLGVEKPDAGKAIGMLIVRHNLVPYEMPQWPATFAPVFHCPRAFGEVVIE